MMRGLADSAVVMSAYMGTTGKWYTVNGTLSRPV